MIGHWVHSYHESIETRQERIDEGKTRQEEFWRSWEKAGHPIGKPLLEGKLAAHAVFMECLHRTRDWALRLGLTECWLSLPICPECCHPIVLLESGIGWRFANRYHWIDTTGKVQCSELWHRREG